MLRGVIKTGIAWMLRSTGGDRAIGAMVGSKDVPLVVGYHRVVDEFASKAESSIPAMLISRNMLERQLDWIGRRYRFVSLDELGSRLAAGGRFARPVAAITFDDGYGDVYHHAFPLLERKGIPAAVFVVTDLIGTGRVQLHDRLYLLLACAFATWLSGPRELSRFLLGIGIWLPEIDKISRVGSGPFAAMRALLEALPQGEIERIIEALEARVELKEGELEELRPLSWEMLAEMQRAGITVGSHTRTHAILTNESRRKVIEEAEGSRRALEARLGIAISHFAYPDGRFDSASVAAVAASGYRFGYTTCPHRDANYPLLTIPRKLLWERSSLDALGRFSSAIMSCQVNGAFDLVAGCRQNHSWPAINAICSMRGR